MKCKTSLYLRLSMILSLLTVNIFADSLSYKINEREISNINKLSEYIGKRLTKKSKELLIKYFSSDFNVSKHLAIILLYKSNRKKYKKELFNLYTIDDYAQRSDDKYNMIGQEDFTTATKKVEEQNSEIKDRRIHLLLLFLYFKDRNEWFNMGTQKMSTARFFRSAFMSSVLKDFGLDASKICNEIDNSAKKRFLNE